MGFRRDHKLWEGGWSSSYMSVTFMSMLMRLNITKAVWLHVRMWECLCNYSHCQKEERVVPHCKFVCPVIILVQNYFRCLFMFMFLPYIRFNPHPIYYLDTAPQASVSGVGLWSDSEHSCRQHMICSRVHCSSGKASWSRVNWPCLVRISSFTWAQDDRATAQRQARYSTGLTCDWWVMYGGFEVTLQYFSSHLAQGTGLWSLYTTEYLRLRPHFLYT